MWRNVLAEVHPNHDPEKAAYFRHIIVPFRFYRGENSSRISEYSMDRSGLGKLRVVAPEPDVGPVDAGGHQRHDAESDDHDPGEAANPGSL
uniref:Uncharacterized protein n=1 Tax=Candidatus Kentrum sp. LFY TaxID=2126342 RepID=A0A450UH62_9GAMM|nr:MAG: hypothetical protein BECKLFY1418A_GA0070994_10194 [Candidatus Kentron sp. LFY]